MVARGRHDRAQTVLVTGGAGFIGSHAVDALAEAGCRVIIIDDLSAGRRDNLKRWTHHSSVDLINADMTEGLFSTLADVTQRLGSIESILHLAAQTSVPRSLQNPLSDLRVNCGGTVQVLEYARYMGVKRVVCASSAAVYGDNAPVPTSEAADTAPVSPYGINKLGSEHFLNLYGRTYALATTAFRFFNVYGPRQSPGNAYSGVISIFMKNALSGEPLVIFGDGEQTRDFIYVGDIARVLTTACLTDEGDGHVINLGTGSMTSVRTLAERIIALTGSASEIRFEPAREGDIHQSVADIHLAERVFDFRPRVTLDDGLRRTLDWMRSAASGA